MTRREWLQAVSAAALTFKSAVSKHFVWMTPKLDRRADDWRREFGMMRASGVSGVVAEIYNGTNAFYVLNLATRTASPLTTLGSASLLVSRDGHRLWAFEKGRPSLAQVSLADLHPVPLPLDRPIDSVFDVARPEGGRSLITLDLRGAGGATVLDALAPDTAASHSYYGLLLEGL